MKKRILSTFLALAMVFTIVPSSFASSASSNEKDIDNVSYLFDNNKLDSSSIKVTPSIHANYETLKIALTAFYDAENIYVETTWDDDNFVDYEDANVNVAGNFASGADEIAVGASFTTDVPYARIEGTLNGQLKQEQTLNIYLDNASISFSPQGLSQYIYEQTGTYNTKVFFNGDMSVGYDLDAPDSFPSLPIRILVVSNETGVNFPVDNQIDLLNYSVDTPTPLTAALVAPALKTTPATTVSGVTVDGAAATAGEVTWSANATAASGNPAAGTGTYTAKFDITAPDGVTFTEGQAFSITIDGATSARAVYKDANTASVTAVFPAITKTAESITATAPTTSVEVGDSYEVKYAPITITYNDGSTQTVDASSASYASSGITVDTS
ncbi:MAG: hypothetical protein IJR33_06190, partial [Clostridia bacterium]|nr:hypothetical protein [Clostridia bacterium]